MNGIFHNTVTVPLVEQHHLVTVLLGRVVVLLGGVVVRLLSRVVLLLLLLVGLLALATGAAAGLLVDLVLGPLPAEVRVAKLLAVTLGGHITGLHSDNAASTSGLAADVLQAALPKTTRSVVGVSVHHLSTASHSLLVRLSSSEIRHFE